MVDITHKSNTLRIATAQAIVKTSNQATIDAIKNDKVPKGNVFAMSKAAGLLGVKKTPELLPDCHPLPIEYAGVDFNIEGFDIKVTVTIKTIYKTGVEVEAMHGASVVALNMYDMLKPIDKGIEIHSIRLIEKKGGKSDFKKIDVNDIRAGIIVCSDSVSAGINTDASGKAIAHFLEDYNIEVASETVVPDDIQAIQKAVQKVLPHQNLIILTGGTGLSPRDVTPEAILPMLDKRIPGAEETIRRYGQDRMPFAFLSRSVVGIKDNALILTLPGSPKGVKESLDAVMPHLLHVFSILKGEAHG
ncbi:bifunctional molybdenum cofactor biosynthesis protein MoaC/MoaB [Aquimarina sp. U1-2]|uniref:bifunctional molybdenum cofactor biosynthesis protein MoaC/MoaB n=1 Tax=Aquimarina sp. U1-2 TaxID=2823141 RepID=UPI001AED0335|nr:bifunctional molybdenum cofactor biosynthesis protein MoaC/MoaB [Aquimarina sp. U1-2]MBP2833794.1 bifunctional molybdenum cofactor biosynthesis protein MoaC/MoaB [Aquimarina sp. U1-2]